jgi:NTE family protein
MTTAFVLSGGANLGAAQAGMLAALGEAGIRPDLIVATSVGAVNGAWIAGEGDIEDLLDVWRDLRRSDVFPAGPVGGLLGFLGRSDHLVSDGGLRRLLRTHLRFSDLESAATPLHVAATDLLTGEGVLLSSGDAIEAILASSAIPGVLPPVVVDGGHSWTRRREQYTVSHAVELDADEVWVVATGYACALDRPPRGALGVALHAATLAIHQRLALDVQRYAGSVEMRVVPPLCPISVPPTDFGQADDLIRRAREHTRMWLERANVGGSVTAITERDLVDVYRHDHVVRRNPRAR